MSQKLTLARYLEGRGAVKSLTRIEAEAFGVPYPLVSGWPARYGDVEITGAMLEDLESRVASARRSTANKARRGLQGLGAVKSESSVQLVSVDSTCLAPRLDQRATAVQALFGFVLRRARRYRARRPAQ